MKVLSLADAVALIPDGASLMIGGFMAVGSPEKVIDELVRQGKRGLTVIANAPNPAGAGILQSSVAFGEDGLSPVLLLLGAIPPTIVAICFFWLVA